tara:strand:- start:1023 stop:1421 length:399 start_codon:yes stop_codon:yes gene_type:complete
MLAVTPIKIKAKSCGVDLSTSWNAMLAPRIAIENSRTYFAENCVPALCHRILGNKFLNRIPKNKAITRGSMKLAEIPSLSRTMQRETSAKNPSPGNIFSQLLGKFCIRSNNTYMMRISCVGFIIILLIKKFL